MKTQTLALVLSFFLLPPVSAEPVAAGAAAGSEALKKVKALEGSWQGLAETTGSFQDVRAEYKIISNGSAVMETLFAGTPEETVSIYYDGEKALYVTHYSSHGSRPVLKFNAEGEMIRFEFIESAGIDPAKDFHLNSLEMTFVRPDAMIQERSYHRNGEPAYDTIIRLERVG